MSIANVYQKLKFNTLDVVDYKKIFFIIASFTVLGFCCPKSLYALSSVFLFVYLVTNVSAFGFVGNYSINTQSNLLKKIIPASLILICIVFFTVRGMITIRTDSEKIALAFIGFSFLVFRAIHVLFEVWRGQIANPKFLDLLLYFSFVPTYFAGPVELWKPFFSSINAKYNLELCKAGLFRIAVALPVKIILVNQFIVEIFLKQSTTSLEEKVTFASVSGFSLANYMYAYFDLWAYTEIAIGVCGILGMQMCENLNRPWQQSNIGAFWRSWHMSVTNWCTYHVYFPIFGVLRNPLISTAASMSVMALWHGTTFNWILWGLHHIIGLVFYGINARRFRDFRKKLSAQQLKFYTFACWILTQSYVILGYFYVGNGLKFIFK